MRTRLPPPALSSAALARDPREAEEFLGLLEADLAEALRRVREFLALHSADAGRSDIVLGNGLGSTECQPSLLLRTTAAPIDSVSTPKRVVAELAPEWLFHGTNRELMGLVGDSMGLVPIQRRRQSAVLAFDGLIPSSFSQGRVQIPVLTPGSRQCFVVDVVGVVCFLIDVIFGPLQVFYSHGRSMGSAFAQFLDILPIFSTLFWTLTLPVGFITAFHDRQGQLVLDVGRIAARYLRSWFFHDVIMVVLDWVAALSPSLSTEASSAFRLVRFLRVLRAARMNNVAGNLVQRLDAQASVVVFLRVVKYFLIMLLLAHVVGCAWYTLAVSYDRSQFNWLDAYEVRERSVHYRIFSSWHWAFAQFGPTKMGHLPTNTLERIFSVLVAAVAMMVNPIVVSRITSSMVALDNLRRKRQALEQQMSLYFHRHQVPHELRLRVRNAMHSYDDDAGVVSLVPILRKLPMGLAVDLKMEIMSPAVRNHALLRIVASAVPGPAEMTLASDGVEDRVLRPGETLFGVGQEASHMYFAMRGEISYESSSMPHLVSMEVISQKTIPQAVHAGRWLSEHALWLALWQHVGMAVAGEAGHCEVFCLNAAVFRRAFQNSFIMTRYARCFLEELWSMHSSDLGQLEWTEAVVQGWRDSLHECADEPDELEHEESEHEESESDISVL